LREIIVPPGSVGWSAACLVRPERPHTGWVHRALRAPAGGAGSAAGGKRNACRDRRCILRRAPMKIKEGPLPPGPAVGASGQVRLRTGLVTGCPQVPRLEGKTAFYVVFLLTGETMRVKS
jgi:hypothetical protein